MARPAPTRAAKGCATGCAGVTEDAWRPACGQCGSTSIGVTTGRCGACGKPWDGSEAPEPSSDDTPIRPLEPDPEREDLEP